MVQHFKNPLRWKTVGYKLEEGKLELGQNVVLARDPNSFPEYFKEELEIDDAIKAKKFRNEIEQAEAVAEEIKTNLMEEELEHDDILIILPEAYTARSECSVIREALKRRNIECHLVGIDTLQEEVFKKGSIAVTHIFRAKGNEAPMVYILNSQAFVKSSNEVSRRNKLFTGITRSRAWVRIYGYGNLMDQLLREIEKVRLDNYKLRFRIPTPEELEQMMVHRSVTPEEQELQKGREESLARIIAAVKKGEIKKSDISKDDQQLLLEFLEQDSEE
jgi:superfamily I DNA and RNA helicase